MTTTTTTPADWTDTYKAHWRSYPITRPGETKDAYWARYDAWRARLLVIEAAMPPGTKTVSP